MKYTGPVRFILKGDADLAMGYTSRSRLLLQQAKDRMGPDKAYWNRTLPDGTEITVSSLGGVDQVWITTPAPDEVSFQKQGYLVLSSEEDQYYPIYKYNPYQVVNDPTEDTVAGNIEWVGRNATVLSWAGGSNRYRTSAGSGTAIYYRGSQYVEAPASVIGAALSNGHIIVVTASAMYHRPFIAGGYNDADLYDEDSAPNGWKEVDIGALPIAGIITALADYTGLKWTGKYSNTSLYDWTLGYNSTNETFSLVSMNDIDISNYSSTFELDTRVTFTYDGNESSTVESGDYGDCYSTYSRSFHGYATDKNHYTGSFKYYLGADYDSDGNLLRASIENDDAIFRFTNQWHWSSSEFHTFDVTYTIYGSPGDYYIDRDQTSFGTASAWRAAATKITQTWTVGNLTKQCVYYYAEARETLNYDSPNTVPFSQTTGPFPSEPFCPISSIVTAGNPASYLGTFDVQHLSQIINSKVLYEDIRYSSAVALEYSDTGYTGEVRIMWYVQDPDYSIEVQVAGKTATRANPPYNLMTGPIEDLSAPVSLEEVFVSAGAEIDSTYVEVHHIDIVPDGNDLLLFIDVTFYGERIINVYSKKNADTYITAGAIAPEYTISEIKAL